MFDSRSFDARSFDSRSFLIDGAVAEEAILAGGGGYLVELDGKRKQETIYLYDEEQEIMEILAAIVPVIELNQRARM